MTQVLDSDFIIKLPKDYSLDWEKVYSGDDIDVLNCPNLDQIQSWPLYSTPLHQLAKIGKIEVLKHPSIDKVKDYFGRTPLHALAFSLQELVIHHVSIDKIVDNSNLTPLHYAICQNINWLEDNLGLITPATTKRSILCRNFGFGTTKENKIKESLTKRYPWFNFKNRILNEKLIDEIINSNNAFKFIGGI